MPWAPELFSEPVVVRLQERERRERLAVPYYAGILSGEIEALIGSFVGEPVIQHPERGRIEGVEDFEAFVAETSEWLSARNASIEDVERIVGDRRGFEEVVIHFDGEDGRVGLPHAMVADHRADGRLEELRTYYSTLPLSGRRAKRSPILPADPELRCPDVVAEYRLALAAGDAGAVAATFGTGGYAREAAGSELTHGGGDDLRAFYARQFADRGGIALDPCAIFDDDRTCMLEYSLIAAGGAETSPAAGFSVFVRDGEGGLAAARIYDDV
jgi:hypothetical protein